MKGGCITHGYHHFNLPQSQFRLRNWNLPMHMNGQVKVT